MQSGGEKILFVLSTMFPSRKKAISLATRCIKKGKRGRSGVIGKEGNQEQPILAKGC